MAGLGSKGSRVEFTSFLWYCEIFGHLAELRQAAQAIPPSEDLKKLSYKGHGHGESVSRSRST